MPEDYEWSDFYDDDDEWEISTEPDATSELIALPTPNQTMAFAVTLAMVWYSIVYGVNQALDSCIRAHMSEDKTS
ncbi:hypothetical protein IWQ60_003001 [Tieghemiomyces parasiticus]|uniref:Uncharacterized protein n=1 Tax=Tieghemiomyces parasiticus TaxID=78921 RepID=A0A9W8E144_9FUNG|nr:hypothetical protein IWQ60_003001 [Tieghemiomyces parasiticus]